MTKTTTLIFFLLSSLLTMSQAGLSAGGGNASNAGASVSYTIGQLDYVNQSNSNGSFNQGVQQPFEFFTIVSIEEAGSIEGLSIYPNPTRGEIFVNLNTAKEKVVLRVYDALGKFIFTQTLSTPQNRLELGALANGAYYIHFNSENGKQNEVIKIIKTN
jgi:hypothetical protein